MAIADMIKLVLYVFLYAAILFVLGGIFLGIYGTCYLIYAARQAKRAVTSVYYTARNLQN